MANTLTIADIMGAAPWKDNNPSHKMNLSKPQISNIATAIKNELAAIGDVERNAIREKVREKFLKTADGKAIARLRMKYDQKNLGADIISKLEEEALKFFPKPFNGYISVSDLELRVSVLSMDAQTGQDIIDQVKREWYAKLKPAVRKQFGLVS